MMATEYWLRGSVEGIPALLQPVAHALLQSRDEVQAMLVPFPATLIWERPNGVASVAFHLQHLTGVLDRLFTYASGQQLNEEQLAYLKSEGKEDTGIALSDLQQRFHQQVEQSLQELSRIDIATLTDERLVGRKLVPSTQIGLLFHAAEHTMRHTGQLLVTVQWLVSQNKA